MKKDIKTIKEFSNIPDCLLMDIGTGTKDVLCFSRERILENNIKLVVPTPSNVMAEKLEGEGRDLSISGYTMGGGYLAKVLKSHLEKGYKLKMEKAPAFTIRNNLEEIRETKVELCEKIEKSDYFFDEIELKEYFGFLKNHSVKTEKISTIGISVQDHGYHTSEESSRRNRFKYFFERLERNPDPKNLVFRKAGIPDVFGRMKSAEKCVTDFNPELDVFLIDTSFSAILGCPFDSRLNSINGPVLYINFGNGHTMACVLYKGKMQAFFEHHTRILKQKPEKIKEYLVRLVEGNLPSDEVFNDDGNGCFTFQSQPFSRVSGIVVTGPQRFLMSQSGLEKYIEAAPAGDMMMTGPLGLLKGMTFFDN
ncbi:MAG: hypothetical protein HQM08_14700 [Candidatus Riflebacteria bacterium]|nr:hypothetical protein [Candidatus Riflebacteria bacterium]